MVGSVIQATRSKEFEDGSTLGSQSEVRNGLFRAPTLHLRSIRLVTRGLAMTEGVLARIVKRLKNC